MTLLVTSWRWRRHQVSPWGRMVTLLGCRLALSSCRTKSRARIILRLFVPVHSVAIIFRSLPNRRHNLVVSAHVMHFRNEIWILLDKALVSAQSSTSWRSSHHCWLLFATEHALFYVVLSLTILGKSLDAWFATRNPNLLILQLGVLFPTRWHQNVVRSTNWGIAANLRIFSRSYLLRGRDSLVLFSILQCNLVGKSGKLCLQISMLRLQLLNRSAMSLRVRRDCCHIWRRNGFPSIHHPLCIGASSQGGLGCFSSSANYLSFLYLLLTLIWWWWLVS